MAKTIFAALLVLLAGCGKSDDPAARAARLSKETEGAVFNGGLTGTIQKGQSVALDASLTLTQTRIACILDDGEIAQMTECGPESGWVSVSAKIPLKELEASSINVASPNRSRGEDGLLVIFSCRKNAGKCVNWTNPMPSSANGGVLCKTQDGCAAAAKDLSALVTLAQPGAASTTPSQNGGADAKLVGSMSSETQGATFNNGDTGSIERHNGLVLEDGAVRLNAEICLGKDGRTLDIARCGVDINWVTITASFVPREINPNSIGISQPDSTRGESGAMVTAKCWTYAGTCVHWSAPAPDQASVSLNCKSEVGCQTVKAGLIELVRLGQQHAVEDAGGVNGIAARMSELRRDLIHVSKGAATVKKGGEVTVDTSGVLHAMESACVLENGDALAETCDAHAEYWSVQETAFALADVDPSSAEDSSTEPELLSYTFYLKCRADRGDCIKVNSTGAYRDTRAVSGTNLLCRDHDACRQMAADLVTLVQVRGP